MSDKQGPNQQLKRNGPAQVLAVFCMMAGVAIFSAYQNFRWHERNNLPAEYQELFSTPINQVQISDYWNSSVGHGTRFAFDFHSDKPIEIRDESSYKTSKVTDPRGLPVWAETKLEWERPSGDVTILLDRSRQQGYTRMHTPIKVAMTRNGQRLVHVLNFPWPNELVQSNEAYNMDWAKKEAARGFHLSNVGEGRSLIAVTYVLDPRDFAPGKFEAQIDHYLKLLDEFNPHSDAYRPHEPLERLRGLDAWSDEKLLELHIPDASLTDAQISYLAKVTSELSRIYANPQHVPIRLKLFVEISDLQTLQPSLKQNLLSCEPRKISW